MATDIKIIDSILKSISGITSIFKPNEALVEEKKKRKAIQNDLLKERAENKKLKLDIRELELQRQYEKKKAKK